MNEEAEEQAAKAIVAMLDRAFGAAMAPKDDRPIGGPQSVDAALAIGLRLFHVHIERESDGGRSCLNVVAKSEEEARTLTEEVYRYSSQFEADHPITVTKCDDETEDEDWLFTLRMGAVRTITAELVAYKRTKFETQGTKPLELPALAVIQ